MRSFLRNFLMALTLIVIGMNCQAQDWDDMTTWIEYKGIKYLAVYAHPGMIPVETKVVEKTSNHIIVGIEFEGVFRDLSCRYEIIRGKIEGEDYIRNIRILEDDFFETSFITWSLDPGTYYPQVYEKLFGDVYGVQLYGASSFDDVTMNKQAASALFIEFLDYYFSGE